MPLIVKQLDDGNFSIGFNLSSNNKKFEKKIGKYINDSHSFKEYFTNNVEYDPPNYRPTLNIQSYLELLSYSLYNYMQHVEKDIRIEAILAEKLPKFKWWNPKKFFQQINENRVQIKIELGLCIFRLVVFLVFAFVIYRITEYPLEDILSKIDNGFIKDIIGFLRTVIVMLIPYKLDRFLRISDQDRKIVKRLFKREKLDPSDNKPE